MSSQKIPPLNNALDDLEDNFSTIPLDAALEKFFEWVKSTGRSPYPHQEEALLALATSAHVVLATPTGSGKSLVAAGAIFLAIAQNRTAYYTAPIKALVSEKFFDLISLFGAANVGMITGDFKINPSAPIICCTAEILANEALRNGQHAYLQENSGAASSNTPSSQETSTQNSSQKLHIIPTHLQDPLVVMDEFHFYGDPERGWAWQIPLLEIPGAQHLLLSATLGDISWLQSDLQKRTGREVVLVDDAPRPVPLVFSYSKQPLQELLQECTQTHRAPVYVVHFTQADVVSTAQELLSSLTITPTQQAAIVKSIGSFNFKSGFGKILSKLLRRGVGVHHAGMLPKYRRLVERLAQEGLIPVICGTDTLGVGINVPIRTVVITTLVKFDGTSQRHLKAREFHQIAGRAGRAGFDTLGEVIVQAPAHEIENERILKRAANDPEKQKRIVRKKPEPGQLSWSEKTFQRLYEAPPERLTGNINLTHSRVLALLARPGNPLQDIYAIATDNHQTHNATPGDRNLLVRQACKVIRSLKEAGIVTHHNKQWRLEHPGESYVQLIGELPDNFAINAPLSPFALAALDLFDPESATYPLDVLSVIETTLENPLPLLRSFQKEEQQKLYTELQLEGINRYEISNHLREVSWPKPLETELETAYNIFSKSQPWVKEHELCPKSIVRKMVEESLTYSDLISRYQAVRYEGVVIRYLTECYQALRQVLPPQVKTVEIQAIITWLENLLRAVDSSLLDEWNEINSKDILPPTQEISDSAIASAESDRIAQTTIKSDQETLQELAFGGDPDGSLSYTSNHFRVRNDLSKLFFTFVEAMGRDDAKWLGKHPASFLNQEQWYEALGSYWDEHEWIAVDQDARSPRFFSVNTNPNESDFESWKLRTLPEVPNIPEVGDAQIWLVEQVILDPEESNEYVLRGYADISASTKENHLVAKIISFGPRVDFS